MAKEARSKSREQIIEIVEQWSHYRLGRIDGGIGYPKQVLLGKIMDGMPGTNCWKCRGSGKILIEAPGIAKARVDCPICDGAGKVKLDYNPEKANPAFITGSGPRFGYNDDPISQRVDWLICTELTEDQRVVLIEEFTRPGNKYSKMRRLNIRLRTYDDLLGEALDRLEEMLDI